MTVQWLGSPRTLGQVLRAPQRRAPVLREPPSRYSFSLVRVLPDCRELVAWSEGPLVLTRAQADARWAQVIPRVTGVGEHPGEGLELRMLRSGRVVKTHPFRQRPAACAGSVGWLGQDLTPPRLVACGPGRQGHWDPVARAVVCRDIPVAGDSIELRHGCYPRAIGTGGQCVPFQCPEGTVRNTDNGECVPPQQPECLDAQEMIAAQPCFYLDQQFRYAGPANLIPAGATAEQVATICSAALRQGYFDLPLCDEAQVPTPPACLQPSERAVLTYCRENGFTGPNPAINWLCWQALKAPTIFAEWERAADCQGAQITEPSCPAGQFFNAVTSACEVIEGRPPLVATTAPARGSLAVPLLIGAAIVAGVALLMSA